MMNILYDHQIFDAQQFGGISRYYSELILGLGAQQDTKVKIGLKYSFNHHLNNTTFSPFFTSPNNAWVKLEMFVNLLDGMNPIKNYDIKYLTKDIINNRKQSIKALRDGCDVFHPTYYDPYFLPHLNGCPFVLTIYDMIHERFMHESKSNVLIESKRKTAENADHIIAISESTKRDVMKLLEIPKEKITVTYLASSIGPPVDTRPLSGVPDDYLLFVGNRGHYKNFDFLIKALKPVFERAPELALICAGSVPFTPDEQQKICSNGVQGHMHHLSVTDETLSRLYANAKIFVYPTQYEGFGLPVLEAMTCGCPVVTTSSSSLPEVGGDAARYFEVNDERGFLEALTPLLDDAEFREKVRERGLKQASNFSWKKVAAETKNVYRSIIA